MLLWSVRLKMVMLSGDSLIVSDYFKTIKVPLREIDDVCERKWVKGHPIAVTFKTDTEFGRKIFFLPAFSFRLFGPHPMVDQLQGLRDRYAGR